MSLPYPSQVYTPFDPLSATELNEGVANDQALAAGTGLDDGAVSHKKLAALNYRANGTSSTQTNVLRQVGWGFHTTPGGTSNGDVTITLPVTLDTFLGILLTPLGYKSGSDPSSVSDFNTGTGFDGASLKTASVSTPAVRVFNTSGGNWGSGERHGFMWEVIGVKN